MDALLNVLLGVVAGVVTLFLIQNLPPRYKWSPEICLRPNTEGGRPIYEARFGRGRYKVWRKRPGPIDVSFYARLSYKGESLRGEVERVVEVPVTKAWRPTIFRAVYLQFLVHEIAVDNISFLPGKIQEKARSKTLTMEDLLTPGEGISAALRVYAFAYRPNTGTRWMQRKRYQYTDIRRGAFQPDGHVKTLPELAE
ncbi:hypothetical protein [Micromonospora parva]|uniref:hypothetical protein n=1 Tax=Micromonospora parva TaxID=1464048 RepID=UPI00366194DF